MTESTGWSSEPIGRHATRRRGRNGPGRSSWSGCRRRVRAVLVAGAVCCAASVVLAAPAGAGEAKGCTWSVTSLDRDGKVIDTASGPGRGATKDDPLSIDPQGTIDYRGTTDSVIADGSWSVGTSGGPSISFGGDVTNDSGDVDKSGTEKLDSRLTVDAGPFGTVTLVSGLIHVNFEATGASGATCTASGWLETTGSSFGSLPFIAGTLVSLLGIGLLLFGWPVTSGAAPGGAGAGTTAGGVGGAPAEGSGPRPGPIGGVS